MKDLKRGGEKREGERHTSDGTLKNWCSRVGSTPDICRRRLCCKGEKRREARLAGRRRWWNTMTGDPPLLFSRSWRQNFKDPHWGQKHSLGPLIITTGVPLFGRGALFWVQNCSAGVPRRSPLYLLLLLSAFSSLRSSSYIFSCSPSVDRSTNIFFYLYRFSSIRPAFINIFVRVLPRKQNSCSRIESFVRLKEI